MKHVKEPNGVVHFMWTPDRDDDTAEVTFCVEDLQADFEETEEDVTCKECLRYVDMFKDTTVRKGDIYKRNGEYLRVVDLDPTLALFEFEYQDGSFSWEVFEPKDMVIVNKYNKPAYFWRIQQGRYNKKFWVGPSLSSYKGAILYGTINTRHTDENELTSIKDMLSRFGE